MHPKLDKVRWDERGVERMEFFVAQRMADDVFSAIIGEAHDCDTSNLCDSLRVVVGQGKPDFLKMTPTEAGVVMASMMRRELSLELVPDNNLHALAYDSIDGIISDQNYDEDHGTDGDALGLFELGDPEISNDCWKDFDCCDDMLGWVRGRHGAKVTSAVVKQIQNWWLNTAKDKALFHYQVR